MKNRIRGLIRLLGIALIAVACKSEQSPVTTDFNEDPVQAQPQRPMPSNDEVLSKLYDPDYSVPDNFYVDERANTPGSYTVYHVKDESVSYELCTDDLSVATAWEEADNASRHVNGYFVGSTENTRYFEFIRELSYTDSVSNVDDLTSPGFSRVFKCSYVVRDGVDRSLLTGYAGTINARPLSDDLFREYVEYFWQFTFFNVRARKVLESFGTSSATHRQRILLLALATRQGDAQCDLVEVVAWTFTVDIASGQVESQFTTSQSFTAELVGGVPQVCAGEG